MIKQLAKALKEATVITDWLVAEVTTNSSQAFYVMQKLETTRLVKTREYHVTVYRKFKEGDVTYMGSSSFVLSHKLPVLQLKAKIEEAAFAASLIKNRDYDLVVGEKKKICKQKPFPLESFALLDQIAATFFAIAKPNVRFNSLELFHNTKVEHIVSSRGIDYKKTLSNINIEAIPSYDGAKDKVELYKYYTYKEVNFDVFRQDATAALSDVTARYQAEAIKDLKKADVILRDEDVKSLFNALIEDYSYDAIYRKNTDKVIGDAIQKDVKGEYLTIALKPASRADAFDRDGVLLSPIKVIDRGLIANYYGSNQYAQYLKIKPSGLLSTIAVAKGKTRYATMKKKPHLQIIALSGIQIDMYSGYIGGEVRLGIYYDGQDYHPVSGFAFSGNIDKGLSSITLSQEMTALDGYEGPKYLKLKDMEII
ncbi:MAG: metallopeptidase TldD-related protein [Bacilli bacterium]